MGIGTSRRSGRQRNSWGKPTAAISETLPRGDTAAATDLAALVSGTLFMMALPLDAGDTVSTITVVSGTTVLGTGSNQWFSLWSAARAKLGVTNDDTSTAWAANTAKTLTLATPYIVPTTGLYYVGVVVVASQVPTLRGVNLQTVINNLAPILSGAADTGLTNPASAPTTAAAITAGSLRPYAYVS